MKTNDGSGRFQVQTPVALGLALRHYRCQAGLSQAQLAELSGLHRSYLAALEGGHETEQLRRILRVLRNLGVGDRQSAF